MTTTLLFSLKDRAETVTLFMTATVDGFHCVSCSWTIAVKYNVVADMLQVGLQNKATDILHGIWVYRLLIFCLEQSTNCSEDMCWIVYVYQYPS